MEIKIEQASVDSFWYHDKIGEIFEAEFCTELDFFEFQIQNEQGIYYVVYGDATIVKQ